MTTGTLPYVKFAQTFYAFAFGIFVAEAKNAERILLCAAGITVAIASLLSDTGLGAYAAPFSGIAFAALVLSLTSGRECSRATSLVLAPIVFLGVISYSIYIWHYQIIYVVEYHYPFFNRHIPGWSKYGMVSGSVLVAICLVFSYFSYLWIEKPSMGRWRVAIENLVRQRSQVRV
jgi:peptidoglycan/LPS O-acetylase OafA/YrhL